MADAAEFTFESSQWTKVLKRLNNKWKDIESRKTFGGIVAAVSFADIREHFTQGQGPNGKWTPRSQPYKKWIESKGKTNVLIGMTANLSGSFEVAQPKFRSNSSGVIIFNRLNYAKKHDEGLDGMPERKFMWLSKKAIDSLIKQTITWMQED